MNLIYCCKNHWVVLFVVAGVFLASAGLFLSIANAAEEAQIQAAINDLSSATGQDITSKDQALELCNQEQYIDVCADIGKKHDLYTAEEIKHVDDFLSEIKGKILNDIKTCLDEECLVKVANELAQKLKTKNPKLATDFNLTAKIIEEKNSVVQAAKEVGLNFRDCEAMDPDTASIDLLRKCAKLAKDSRVQKYIPEEKRVLAEQFEDSATIKLREALSAGKYQCGDGTLEGCGNFCLNPTQGMGIPPVCAQIASEIFGQDGVKQLEAAHQQVGQVKDYYSKKFILTLPDGRELVGEGQIRNACDLAFSNRDIEIAKACGSFAVKNGFATQSDVDRGLKLVEFFTQKAPGVKFEQCVTNPETCRDFIPDEERNRFDAGSQIFEIMRSEIGFDPQQCERGAADESISQRCFEGSKRALVKIESLGLANKSQEARFIIEEIKGHLADGENMNQRKDEFRQVFSQQGGPGGCRSEAECFSYCSNPINGPECISFGSKHDVSGFRGQEAIQKFQEYNQNVQKSSDVTSNEYRAYPSDGGYPQFPGQGPYPGFQPGDVPPGQFPGFTQPGPGFSPPPGQPYYPGPRPVGPSPECFAAIQSGDFVRAKTLCESKTVVPLPSFTPIGPPITIPTCPQGQYWDGRQCQSPPTYSPGPYPIYSPSGNPVLECQKRGGVWDPYVNDCRFPDPLYSPSPTYLPGPDRGWINKTWKFKDGSTQSSSILNRTDSEYTGHINNVYNSCSTKYFAGWKPGGGDQSKWQEFGIPICSDTVSTSPSPYPTGSPGTSPTYSPYPTTTGGTGEIYSCFYPNATKNGTSPGYTVWCEKGYFNCHEGSNTGPSISLDGVSLGAPSSCESGYQGQSCNNNKFCDSNETSASCPNDCGGVTYSPYPSPGVGGCPSGHHYHSESGGFCLNDQENYGGTCYNSAGTSKINCPVQPTSSPYPYPSGTPTSSGSCPSGSHTMYVNNAGGYCMSDSDGTKCGPLNSTSVSGFGSCSTYQGSTYSPYPTSTTYTPSPSCPSGQWWDTARQSCTSTATSCGSGYYWDSAGNICKPNPTTSYIPPPSCPSDQWWDYTTSSCKSSTSTSYTPYPTSTYTPSPTCSSTQYWNGTSCVDNATATTYTPYPTTEYTPPPTYEATPPPYSPPPADLNSSPPPPTSGLYPHYMAMHCQQLGRTWNGKICEANGLFARFFEGSGMANALRLFYIIP